MALQEQFLRHWGKLTAIAAGFTAIAGFIVLPVNVVAWAEDLVDRKVRDAAIAQQAREEVIHGSIKAKHDFDLYSALIEDTEDDLVELEELAEEGVEWTPTQQRKYEKAQRDLEKFEEDRQDALSRLEHPEGHDETHTESDH